MIYFGTAGFDFADWSGPVYPKPKPKGFDPLAFLATYLSTIEINSSFYRPPSAATAKRWCERVAHVRDFQFTAKLSQRFTHERKTAWTRAEVKETRAAFDAMLEAGRLGAVLMQFPWSFRNVPENREWLSGVIDAFKEFPLVLEVRHQSWSVAEVYEDLVERGVGVANIDQPLFKNSIKPESRATSAVGYVRVHGRNYQDWFRGVPKNKGNEKPAKASLASRDDRYNYLYTAKELEPWAERIGELSKREKVANVFVVGNNHFGGRAVANVLMLKSMVEGHKVPAPPGTIAAYGDVLQGYVDG